MNITNKLNKLKKVKKDGNLTSFLCSKLKKEKYKLKVNLMAKGITPYVRETIEAESGRRYLEKEYAWYLESSKKTYETSAKLPKVVWWCWLQGLSDAPIMVKMCLDSIKRNFKGYKINIVTWDNLNNYIDIPDYIMYKFKLGIIPYAQFSDIIRILLLAKYGGVWIDSTVYCSNSRIVSVIENQDFFVYQNGLLGNNQDIKISNWFISSKSNELFTQEMKKLLLDYWKKHDYLENYFIFHLFFTLITEKYPEEWKKVPAFNNVSPHMMVRELNYPFSYERYAQLDSFSSLHKLNHHIEFDKKNNTLYSKLIREYKNCKNII